MQTVGRVVHGHADDVGKADGAGPIHIDVLAVRAGGFWIDQNVKPVAFQNAIRLAGGGVSGAIVKESGDIFRAAFLVGNADLDLVFGGVGLGVWAVLFLPVLKEFVLEA